jgi:hypothetical protein
VFLVEKFFANGDFDKIKARLVSHGNKQDNWMVLALFAGNMRRHTVCKIDVKGAFMQTPMEGEAIYLKVSKDIVKHIVDEFPEYQKFVTKEGTMFVRILVM